MKVWAKTRTQWRPRAILDPVRAAEQRVGKQFGFAVMSRAKGLISPAASAHASSAAGSPPVSHLDLLRKWIQYGWDAALRTVLIGPKLLKRRGAAPALKQLEEGGSATILRKRANGVAQRRNVTFRPHPYMGPAFLAEIRSGTLERLWTNAVK